MRRVRSDVSHRIRRQPSIFSVLWFRVALGVGVALVLALLVGPWVSSWFGGDLPRSLFLLVPGGGSAKTAQARAPEPPSLRPSLTSPGVPSSDAAQAPVATISKAPGAPAEDKRGTGGRTAAGGSTPAATPSTAAAAPAAPPKEPRRPAPPEDASAPSGPLAAPPAVYWVQVGAFLDHRNADRLAERLRGDGLSAATTSFEQSRVLYRVAPRGRGGRPRDRRRRRARPGSRASRRDDRRWARRDRPRAAPEGGGDLPRAQAAGSSGSPEAGGELVDLPRRAAWGPSRRSPRPTPPLRR